MVWTYQTFQRTHFWFLRLQIDHIPWIGPWSNLNHTFLHIIWPISQIQIAEHLKLRWWHPQNFSSWINNARCSAIVRDIITQRWVIQNNIGLPHLMISHVHRVKTAIIGGIPFKLIVVPGELHPTINGHDRLLFVNVNVTNWEFNVDICCILMMCRPGKAIVVH